MSGILEITMRLTSDSQDDASEKRPNAQTTERDPAVGTKLFTIRIAALFLIIVAVLLDLPYLYLMALSLALLPYASLLLGRRLHGRFGVRREHATTALEGRVVPITLRVFAEGGLPQATLRVADALPPELAGAGDGSEIAPLGDWDGQQGSRTYHVEPARRGVYRLGPTRVVTGDPLGLFSFSLAVPGHTEIVVHPTPIAASSRGGGGGSWFGVQEREGRARRGEGMDFHGVREWRQGDTLRRVHWPTTARTGSLAVVEFERAFQQDAVIALDLRRGTEHGQGRETTLEYAVKTAATLIDRALSEGSGVTLITQAGSASAGGGRRRAGSGNPATDRFLLFDLLARARAEWDGSLAEALEGAYPGERAAQHLLLLTAAGDPAVSAFLTGRVARGDTLRVFFFEPASFGGPVAVTSPAVAGADLRIVRRGEHSPWREGGKDLVYLLRDS
jgi:uncharacterized protein (DUF58 family)